MECLGQTFESDAVRRKHYLGLLAEKLTDPEFRKTPGFPKGDDEAILQLSDPPYFTACPNPFMEEFIRKYGKPFNPGDSYSREPFTADVSEGKYDPLYKFHPYPTKVPHKAIMRYILHYTCPGDVVFDGFCGTGMTGVAAQMCGDRSTVESLGYLTKPDGTILRKEVSDNGKESWIPFSELGERRVVLSDLSPSATFIADSYNSPIDAAHFDSESRRILEEVEEECSWMYKTAHKGEMKGNINYTVWSDVFICPDCAGEIVFWDDAVDEDAGKVRGEFPCPKCQSTLTKRGLDRAWHTKYDRTIKATVRQVKQIPVRINYSIGSTRHEKTPDEYDLELIKRIEDTDVSHWFPSSRMIKGKETRRNDPYGLTHVHHFYSRRNLHFLSRLASKLTDRKQLLLITKVAFQITKLYRFTYQNGTWGAGGGPLSGTLYVPSLVKELNIANQIRSALKGRAKIANDFSHGWYIGSTMSSTHLAGFPSDSADYIFVDPPFGANLNYSELACLWEAWLKVATENTNEAIENDAQGKGLGEYRSLMNKCFKEAYRVLKPGRWMTVEFSNTKASVWNSIQTALTESGFIVSNVSALDKKKGSFKAVTTPTAVKQDLVISAYKPSGGLKERLEVGSDSEGGVWDFVRNHLGYLPVVKAHAGELMSIPERDPRILFDQLVAYYVRHGFPIPISSQEFVQGLIRRFPERDGMFFLPDQAAEYDKKRMAVNEDLQLSLFVSDEASAIQWLKRLLSRKPQTYQDINPQFLKEIGGWNKYEVSLELADLLKENFLKYDGNEDVPSPIHNYLSTNFKGLRKLGKGDLALRAKAKDRWYVPDHRKSGDLEKLRLRALLKEFDVYRTCTSRKIKEFRTEAIRAGFKHCYDDGDYQTIVNVAAKLPEQVIQEDEKLLMYHDVAIMRLGM